MGKNNWFFQVNTRPKIYCTVLRSKIYMANMLRTLKRVWFWTERIFLKFLIKQTLKFKEEDFPIPLEIIFGWRDLATLKWPPRTIQSFMYKQIEGGPPDSSSLIKIESLKLQRPRDHYLRAFLSGRIKRGSLRSVGPALLFCSRLSYNCVGGGGRTKLKLRLNI